MTDIKKLACPYCGNADGSRIVEGENGKLMCDFCGTSFFTETAKGFYEKLVNKLSEAEREKLQKNLRNLNREAQEKYPEKDFLLSYAKRVKELEPDHPIANLYELICTSGDSARTERYFRSLKEQKLTVETKSLIARRLIENFRLCDQLALADYISTEIQAEDIDAYKRLFSRLEDAAEKENAEVFNPRLRRDVFIAHSSADARYAKELATALDKAGRTYFLSSINLRHGFHAKAEYESSLQDAIRACKIFVVINTKNSRSPHCDVYRKEIPFVETLDEKGLPPEYRHLSYENIPTAYKKPRINYLIEPYTGTVQDKTVKAFFDGFEYRRTIDDVLIAVERLLRKQAESEYTAPTQKPVPKAEPVTEESDIDRKLREAKEALERTKKEAEEKKLATEREAREEEERRQKEKELADILAEQERVKREAEEAARKIREAADAERKRKEVAETERMKYINAKVGQLVEFGHYPQDSRGTDKTPIQWRVLENDGNELLLLSEKILDCVPYNKEYKDITWKDCTLRKWLNKDFYNTAFSETEKWLISLTRCTGNGVKGANDFPETDDKVFLLSTEEIKKYAGVLGTATYDEKRRTVGTAYAKKKGLYAYRGDDNYGYLPTGNTGNPCSWWWLRNSGSFGASCAAFVSHDGNVFDEGGDVCCDNLGVRSVLKLNLKS